MKLRQKERMACEKNLKELKHLTGNSDGLIIRSTTTERITVKWRQFRLVVIDKTVVQ